MDNTVYFKTITTEKITRNVWAAKTSFRTVMYVQYGKSEPLPRGFSGWIEVTQYGKTEDDARAKLDKFLGPDKTECNEPDTPGSI